MSAEWPTECDEVAGNMKPPRFASFDEAAAWVRVQMNDPGMQIVDNVAEALMSAQATCRKPDDLGTFNPRCQHDIADGSRQCRRAAVAGTQFCDTHTPRLCPIRRAEDTL